MVAMVGVTEALQISEENIFIPYPSFYHLIMVHSKLFHRMLFSQGGRLGAYGRIDQGTCVTEALVLLCESAYGHPSG